MFRIICNHPNTPNKQKFDGFKNKEIANNYCSILSQRGYFNFKITEYSPEKIKPGTNKSRAIKAYFGGGN